MPNGTKRNIQYVMVVSSGNNFVSLEDLLWGEMGSSLWRNTTVSKYVERSLEVRGEVVLEQRASPLGRAFDGVSGVLIHRTLASFGTDSNEFQSVRVPASNSAHPTLEPFGTGSQSVVAAYSSAASMPTCQRAERVVPFTRARPESLSSRTRTLSSLRVV